LVGWAEQGASERKEFFKMAGIDVGGHGGKKSVNHEIPLIPFIDFLLCLVSFLLITAVWTQMARINANAQVPGPPNPNQEITEQKDKTLHVEMKGESNFQLVWKEGSTVLNTIDVPRKADKVGEDEIAYSELATKIEEEWNKNETRHFAATDPKMDQAVLHTDNSTPFQDVIAVIDAIYKPQREVKEGNEIKKRSAFNVTFSVN
jgi:biopolymer transport protein ExbD